MPRSFKLPLIFYIHNPVTSLTLSPSSSYLYLFQMQPAADSTSMIILFWPNAHLCLPNSHQQVESADGEVVKRQRTENDNQEISPWFSAFEIKYLLLASIRHRVVFLFIWGCVSDLLTNINPIVILFLAPIGDHYFLRKLAIETIVSR